MSDALMDLHAHYKAVRARLNAGPPPTPQTLPEPKPEPIPEPPVVALVEPPPATLAVVAPIPEIMIGLRSTTEVKDKILPILEKHQISWKDAAGKSQQWKYTKCRFEIYVKLYAHGWSLSQIGRLCGDRDHTTVLNGIKRFVKKNLTEEEVAVCQAAGMRPVDYWEGKTLLREMRDA
jgi:hypothetical protein